MVSTSSTGERWLDHRGASTGVVMVSTSSTGEWCGARPASGGSTGDRGLDHRGCGARPASGGDQRGRLGWAGAGSQGPQARDRSGPGSDGAGRPAGMKVAVVRRQGQDVTVDGNRLSRKRLHHARVPEHRGVGGTYLTGASGTGALAREHLAVVGLDMPARWSGEPGQRERTGRRAAVATGRAGRQVHDVTGAVGHAADDEPAAQHHELLADRVVPDAGPAPADREPHEAHARLRRVVEVQPKERHRRRRSRDRRVEPAVGARHVREPSHDRCGDVARSPRARAIDRRAGSPPLRPAARVVRHRAGSRSSR